MLRMMYDHMPLPVIRMMYDHTYDHTYDWFKNKIHFKNSTVYKYHNKFVPLLVILLVNSPLHELPVQVQKVPIKQFIRTFCTAGS